MLVVDAHAHIYPDNLADKAMHAIAETYGVDDTHKEGVGTADFLLSRAREAGISKCIVHSVATTAHAVTTINDFIANEQKKHPEFIGFGTMHQDFEDMEAEVNRMISLGLHGVKIHPDMQHVNMDDPRFMNLYEIIEGRLPIVIHCGDYRTDFSSPERLLHILKTFPDLKVDGAHFAAWSRFDVGYDVLKDVPNPERLFCDASSSLWFLGGRHMVELTRMWGADRIMFGSDYPMWDPADELKLFLQAGYTDAELEQILGTNALRFAGI